jgi:hypothetical protein
MLPFTHPEEERVLFGCEAPQAAVCQHDVQGQQLPVAGERPPGHAAAVSASRNGTNNALKDKPRKSWQRPACRGVLGHIVGQVLQQGG